MRTNGAFSMLNGAAVLFSLALMTMLTRYNFGSVQVQAFVVQSTHHHQRHRYQTINRDGNKASTQAQNAAARNRRGGTCTGPLSMAIVAACTRVNDIVYSKKVVIFGVSDEAQTLRIEELFNIGHVQYTSVYLDKIQDRTGLAGDGAEMMEAIKQMTGRDKVPCIYIDGKFIGGEDHVVAMNISGYLGKLLREVGAIPYDRMRDLKSKWRRPSTMHLTGSTVNPQLT